MGISLDLYDFFAHVIPGGVCLVAFLYGFQEPWLRSPAFASLSTPQLLGLGLLSYVLGYVIDPIGKRWYRLFRARGRHPKLSEKAASQLCQRYPWMKIDQRASNWYVLLAYIKRHNLPMAQELERFNVTHIMLRGLSLGLLLFAFVFGAKIITGSTPVYSVLFSLLSLAAAYVLMQEAIRYRVRFYQSIYQSSLALTLTPEQLPVSCVPGYDNGTRK